MNWVLQLNNSQLENSFNSLLDKRHVSYSPNLPNPNPNQSLIDRGNLETQKVFVDNGKTSRSHEIDEKRLHKELGSSDRSGTLDNLSENTRVEQTHDGSGQPDEFNSSRAHSERTICS